MLNYVPFFVRRCPFRGLRKKYAEQSKSKYLCFRQITHLAKKAETQRPRICRPRLVGPQTPKTRRCTQSTNACVRKITKIQICA